MSAVISRLEQSARRNPERVALVDDFEQINFAQLRQRVSLLSRALDGYGIRTLAISAANCVDWIVADLAALESGITLVPVPPFFSPQQVDHLLSVAAADALFVDENSGLESALRGAFGSTDAQFGRLSLLRSAEPTPQVAAGGERAAKITFTSGSTGEPKGVCLGASCIDAAADRIAAAFAQLDIEHHLCIAPLAVLLENIAGVYVPLALGATMHLPSARRLGISGSSKVDIGQFRRCVRDTDAHSMILQPQLLRILTAAAGEHGWQGSSLRFVAVGGARVSADDLADAQAAGIPAYQGYGLSECASVVAINRPHACRPASVGRPLPGIDIRIADDGEILVSGQSMIGYAGQAPVEPGFMPTGDLGHLDGDGFLYVTGRKKDVFITSFGRNVSPEWPEAELLHQPEIAQACVFGEARPFNTAVVVAADAATTEDAIARAILRANRKLPDYARVADWIRADAPFSAANGMQTTTGKNRRAEIGLRYLEARDEPSVNQRVSA